VKSAFRYVHVLTENNGNHIPQQTVARCYTHILSKRFYFLKLFFLLLGSMLSVEGIAQVTTVNIDLSSSIDTSITLNNTADRNGVTCGVSPSGNTNCIVFNVKLNPASDQISFDIIGASGLGSAAYQVNCGTPTSLATPICLNGITTASISFCKNGNNPYTYKISVSSLVKGSADLTLRQFCSGTMSITGLQASTVNWESIFPGSVGQYNNYLSCTSGCSSTTVTPQAGSPAYIDYRVYGSSNSCGAAKADTIRVYTTAAMAVSVTPSSPAICSGASTPLTASVTGGNPPYVYSWSTGSSANSITASTIGTYSVTVSDNTTGCAAITQTATVTAAATPAAPTIAGTTICAGNTATLTATAPGGTYQWYDAPTGGNLFGTGVSYTTPVLTANTTYYVQTTVSSCPSSRTAVTVSVTAGPAAPTAASAIICAGNTATLTATAPGGSYQWYDAASGGNLLASSAGFTTPVLNSNTTYYVQTTVSGCTGSRTPVTVSVNSAPATPTVLGATICAGNSTSLTATAPGGSYQWFDAASGGNLLASNATYNSPVLNSSATYYVQTTVSGCTGSRAAVTVTVTPTPSAPTLSGTAICAGNSTSLSATAPGGTYQWYDAATGGNLLTTGSTYTTPVLNSSVTYYVQTTVSGCTGPRAAITASVAAIPAAPSASTGSICSGNSITLTATGPGGSYQWYDAANGGTLLASAASYTTDVLTASTNYFVQTTVSGCTSSRTQVTATVIPKQDPAFVYASGTFCITGTNPTPTIVGSGSGSFSASPAGLVFVNNSTGEINLSASALGTYTIQFVTSGVCTYSSSSKITITNSPNASFSFAGPYCPQQLTALPDFPALASAGTFSSANPALVFKNSSTGEIDLKKSTPGTYTVVNNIAAAGGCMAANASNTVTINTEPTVSAGVDQTVCGGTPITLTGTIGGTATTASWSGGQGTFSTANQLSSQYTPAAGETTAKLFLTTDDPAGPCSVARDTVTLYIIPATAAPTSVGVSVCVGNTAVLAATQPGGNYEWFTVATGGTAIHTTAVYTTPALTATTTYYVQTTLNSCTGPRTAVTVTVSPKPTVTSAPAGDACSATRMTYNILSDQPGSSYTWSRAVVTGISNPQAGAETNSSITEVLNNTTSSSIAVVYRITPINKGCTGDVFLHTVTVNPTPASPTLTNSSPVCVGTTLSLFAGTVSGASYQWTGPNNFSSTLQNPVINDVVLASAGNYQVSVTVNGCTSQPTSKNIAPVIAAPEANSNSPVCVGNTIQLSTAGLAGANYQWSGPQGFSSLSQNPTLPSAATDKAGLYIVTAFIAGCAGLKDTVEITVNVPPGPPSVTANSPVCTLDSIVLKANGTDKSVFRWSGPNNFISESPAPVIPKVSELNAGTYNVTARTPGCAATSASSIFISVNQIPNIQLISNNGPLCVGSTLSLSAASLPGAAFQWGSVSGFSSSLQNPVIANVTQADSSTYFVTATRNGCKGDTAFTKVAIVAPATANAGTDLTVCANNATVKLNGSITGEDTQTGIWSTTGKGLFAPNANTLTAVYVPSREDTAQRGVTVTLATTNNKVCAVSTSSIQILINPAPFAQAGNDLAVCSNDSLINLQGLVGNAGGGQWQSSGTGSFKRSATDPLQAVYTPSRTDILKGKVDFYLTTTNNGTCFAAKDTVQYRILPIPFVNAGEDLILFEKENFVLSPQITGNDLQYLWTPSDNLSSPTVKNPVLTAANNQTYRIKVTGTGNCSVEDELFVRVLKQITIPNIFSPNGDGIFDLWQIPQLANYPGATVEIFTRTGQKIFSSVGYDRPWDGTFNGKPVPLATYYYIIRPNFRNLLFSGSVTVIR
jgi:gliding motility-associated-like protein